MNRKRLYYTPIKELKSTGYSSIRTGGHSTHGGYKPLNHALRDLQKQTALENTVHAIGLFIQSGRSLSTYCGEQEIKIFFISR